MTHEDDAPELTAERAARLRPARETLSETVLARFKRGPGRPKADAPKALVSLRLDQDVVEAFKSAGPGWQTRMNDALRAAVSSPRP